MRSTDFSLLRFNRMRPRPGVQFTNTCANFARRVDLFAIGVNEQAHGNARARKHFHNFTQPRNLSRSVKAAFGGQLLATLWNQHGRGGFDLYRKRNHVLGGRHFKMKSRGHMVLQRAHIGVLNVPAIFAQMNRDSIGAAKFGLLGGMQWIGIHALAGLA